VDDLARSRGDGTVGVFLGILSGILIVIATSQISLDEIVDLLIYERIVLHGTQQNNDKLMALTVTEEFNDL